MIKKNQSSDIKKPIGVCSLDQLLPNVGGSIFCLTRVAMLRALEIHMGSPSLIENCASDKETTIALNEIAQGRIGFKNKQKRS